MMLSYAQISPDQKAFFQDVMEEMKRLTQKYPAMTNMECAAILSRAVGLCLASVPEADRPRVRQMAYDNIELAISQFGARPTVN